MKKKEELSWADIKAMYAETSRQFKEIAKQSKETDRQFKETDKKLKEMYEKTNQQIGGISRSNGEFCEEYFINSFKTNPTFMGEKFERVIDYLKPEPAVINDEYDLVLRNGKTVVLIEMKYKAGTDDVGKMFSKLHSYRANYPMFKDYRIYLCLASFRFPAKVRERAEKEGIVLIQQRGDRIEVISENVKTW
jgi:DNA-binding transcriptional MerR regulator